MTTTATLLAGTAGQGLLIGDQRISDHGSEIAQEEVFGPVLSVLRFTSESVNGFSGMSPTALD